MPIFLAFRTISQMNVGAIRAINISANRALHPVCILAMVVAKNG